MKKNCNQMNWVVAAITGGTIGAALAFILQMMFLNYVYKNPDVYGNVADWVSGVGTMLTIIVSLFILHYQTNKSVENTKHQFFVERNNSNFDKAEILVVNDMYTLDDIKVQVKNIISKKTYPFNESSINIQNAKKISCFLNQLDEMNRNLSLVIIMLSRFEEKQNVANLLESSEGIIRVQILNSDLAELKILFNQNSSQSDYEKVIEKIEKLKKDYMDEYEVIKKLRNNINV